MIRKIENLDDKGFQTGNKGFLSGKGMISLTIKEMKKK